MMWLHVFVHIVLEAMPMTGGSKWKS